MKKVYRIYTIERILTAERTPEFFAHALDRHGAREYESYEEAEDVVIGNEIKDATILAVYVNS